MVTYKSLATNTLPTWVTLNGKPFVTVSPIGLSTGASQTNNGADYGPDTPNTTTSGIQEALNSANPVFLLTGKFILSAAVVLPQFTYIHGVGPEINAFDTTNNFMSQGTEIVGAAGTDIFQVNTAKTQLHIRNMALHWGSNDYTSTGVAINTTGTSALMVIQHELDEIYIWGADATHNCIYALNWTGGHWGRVMTLIGTSNVEQNVAFKNNESTNKYGGLSCDWLQCGLFSIVGNSAGDMLHYDFQLLESKTVSASHYGFTFTNVNMVHVGVMVCDTYVASGAWDAVSVSGCNHIKVDTLEATPAQANISVTTSTNILIDALNGSSTMTLASKVGLKVTNPNPTSLFSPMKSVFPTNPTGTSSATGVMMGLGAQATPTSFTPTFSGRVRVKFTGYAGTATAIVGALLNGYYGSGAAPANGAAQTGTAWGVPAGSDYQVQSSAIGVDTAFFAVEDIVTGLTVGTSYWFDLLLLTVNASDAASIINISFTIEEF